MLGLQIGIIMKVTLSYCKLFLVQATWQSMKNFKSFGNSRCVNYCIENCIYRSVPLVRPPILYTISSPKWGGGVLSRMQLASTIHPLEKFLLLTQTIMTLPMFMFTVQMIVSTSCDHAVVFLHQREELQLQHEGPNIHDEFAVAILKNSSTARHVPWDISWYFLQKSGSEMTCIVDVNDDYSASERRSEVAHV